MDTLVLTDPESISSIFTQCSRYGSPQCVSVSPETAGGGYLHLTTEWIQSEPRRGARLRFAQQHTLLCGNGKVLRALPPGHCSTLQGELLCSNSPSGMFKAVVRETELQGAEHQFLEIWSKQGTVKSLDLTSMNKHGRVYDDVQFGCLAWSACEGRLLYAAEKKPYLVNAGAGPSGEEVTGVKQDCSLYHEDWGEGLTSKSIPVLCVADIDKGSVQVLAGVPQHVSPGQAVWALEDDGVLFIGWWHEPFRLGLKFCSNRRSALFHVDFEGNCECLSSDSCAISCPRVSPDGRYIVYLQGQAFGPHNQCLSLQLFDWLRKKTSLLVDVVTRPEKGEFAGLYERLPGRCWSSDSQRVVFSSLRGNWRELFVVDRCSRRIMRLSENEDCGSWKLLAVDRDLMVVSCSSPSSPPCLKVGFLPPAGGEAGILWTTLEGPCEVLDIEWRELDIIPPPQEENPEYSGLNFGAILMKPRVPRPGVKVPLVVFAHGGPHTQFCAEWNMPSAALARVGFAVLMVNYRGSTGFGQDSILSLIGNIGSQDVKDVQRAVVMALQSDTSLDSQRVAVMGGSHGGFLVCHLIGQYPDFYQACAARNPVINAATLLGTSDIVDWRYSVVGLQYSYERLPSSEDLALMLKCSPIVHAPQIRTPVLLMLGGKDRRVSPHQGLELYRALKSRSSPVRLLWFPEDGHSLSQVDTQVDCFLNTVLWFVQHMDLM